MRWARAYDEGMDRRIVYVSRLTRLPLLGSDGNDVGRVVDAVIDLGSKPPRINGVVVAVQRRRVFVGIGRIGEIGVDGARLRRGSVNLRQFQLREGERLLSGEVMGSRVRGRRVVDIGLTPAPEPLAWEVTNVALASRRVPGLRRAPELIDWSEAGELFASDRPLDRQAAELGGLHPTEMAAAIRRLPLSRRRVLAGELEDERLADLLEELSEDEQVRLVENLDPGAARPRAGRDGGRRRGRPAGRVLRGAPGPAAAGDGSRGGRAGAAAAQLSSRTRPAA